MDAILKFLMDYIGQIPTGVFYTAMIVLFGAFYRNENVKHNEIKMLLKKQSEEFELKAKEHEIFFKKLDEHDESFRKGNERFAKMDSNIDRTYIVVLRDTIYNDKLVIKDRLAAFNEYKRMGGNGYTDVYYETHLLPIAQAQIEAEKINSSSE